MSDTLVVCEEATLIRELMHFGERMRPMTLGWAAEVGRKDCCSLKLDVPNGSLAGGLIWLFAMLIDTRQAPHRFVVTRARPRTKLRSGRKEEKQRWCVPVVLSTLVRLTRLEQAGPVRGQRSRCRGSRGRWRWYYARPASCRYRRSRRCYRGDIRIKTVACRRKGISGRRSKTSSCAC